MAARSAPSPDTVLFWSKLALVALVIVSLIAIWWWAVMGMHPRIQAAWFTTLIVLGAGAVGTLGYSLDRIDTEKRVEKLVEKLVEDARRAREEQA